jgi:hypothetical protein
MLLKRWNQCADGRSQRVSILLPVNVAVSSVFLKPLFL